MATILQTALLPLTEYSPVFEETLARISSNTSSKRDICYITVTRADLCVWGYPLDDLISKPREFGATNGIRTRGSDVTGRYVHR